MSERKWRGLTADDRFFMNIIPVTESGCLLWLGSTAGDGYAKFTWDGKQSYGHIYAWERVHGPVPEGFELDHLCRVHCCVNDLHVEPVTSSENKMRGVRFLPMRHDCKFGHPLTGDNVRTSSSGQRYCRICDRRRAATKRSKSCTKAYFKKWQDENREKVRAYNRKCYHKSKKAVGA